jgi:hypothetical protein
MLHLIIAFKASGWGTHPTCLPVRSGPREKGTPRESADPSVQSGHLTHTHHIQRTFVLEVPQLVPNRVRQTLEPPCTAHPAPHSEHTHATQKKHYKTLLQVSTISEHKLGGILCNVCCVRCVPYNPVLHLLRPCWAVVMCLLPSMFGHKPGPGQICPTKSTLFHNRVRLR